ncbi:heat stress transcription factor B-4 [Ricinus communis]|uniref:DNA binding protein, putative n=1 Tax=Ricinus communis TaxID=3988 RepID=B9R7A7_RICCO|nr:heat stress transcription factor B-4 [Ricinus communis]EEF52387.1 DNA binding protein, putative [Ricinus communis]|eukprot:XP_002510200.1 heat stress transcription factor B-4 [Ricinus communis]
MAFMLDNCEGILLSLDSHKSVPAPFLTKTYQLVDDPATDHIVSWGEDDATFVVWRPPEFARDLLPNYFKHNNFSSFVRQLNTYGFRKIVPDRWEFANEFFKKGEKHLLCEIHRRKTAQPQVAINHHHHHPHSPLGVNGPSFFPFSSRVSISPSESDEQPNNNNNWCDSPPLTSPRGGVPNASVINGGGGYNSSVTALSEDNERLRRSNNMLMSELAHMRKLYNDIIYFVQNHVKPVTPSNSYPSSLLLCAPTSTATPFTSNGSLIQKPLNQLLGYYNPPSTNSKLVPQVQVLNSPTSTSQSSLTFLDEGCKNTKLFGVPLQSKKRLHSEYNASHTGNMETSKARLMLEKDDLGLNLMPPSTC